MKIFILWLFILNLFGFYLMFIDKKRAQKKRWRIRESHLLLVAILGGSIGSLIGMYVFHHKTRHKKFTVGIPMILILQIMFCAVLISHVIDQSPQRVLANHLAAFAQASDTDTTSVGSVFLADLSGEGETNALTTEDTVKDSEMAVDALSSEQSLADQVAALFYQDFHYEIANIDIKNHSASAQVSLTTPDTTSLATDLCLALTRRKLTSASFQDNPSENDLLTLMKDTLENHQYTSTISECTIELKKSSGRWFVVQDDAYRNAVTGGLIDKINDPWLPEASEILSVYLDYYNELTAQDWQSLFDQKDLFGTGSETYSAKLDQIYCEKLADVFHTELVSCETTGTKAVAKVSLTTLDLPSLIEQSHADILSYAQSADAVTDDENTQNDTVARCLLTHMQSQAEQTETEIEITLKHNASGWYPIIDDEVTQAFMGHIQAAIDLMKSW